MTTLFCIFHRNTEPKTVAAPVRPLRLTRTYVETGDERCPIAGIWSRLDANQTLDEPEIRRPVMRRLLPWRAFHPLFSILRYSIS